MKNVTISIDEDLLKEGRKYAQKHKISFNSLMRRLLATAVQEGSSDWTENFFQLADEINYRSGGIRDWKREDLYRV
jgi:hypothetical protein